MNSLIPFVALAGSALLAAGCASTGTRQADKAAVSLQKAAVGYQDTLPSLDAALFALSDLVNETGVDMAPQFRIYSEAVRRLESQETAASVPAVAMQRECLDYFETRNRSRAGIVDGGVRMRSLDRMLLVGAQFERARHSCAQSRSDFGRFMADLRDIRASLASDLTPDGLDSIRDLASRVAADGGPLRVTLQDLSDDFRSLGVAVASSVPDS